MGSKTCDWTWDVDLISENSVKVHLIAGNLYRRAIWNTGRSLEGRVEVC